jgi:Spy/CpxP family protein refolding chaperone
MKRYLIAVAVILLAALAWGQVPEEGVVQDAAARTFQTTAANDDPIAQTLFPPELVMKYRQEINLDDNQSRAMKDAIQKAQAKFLDLQWDMQTEQQKLVQLLKAQPVDENAALAQVDRVLSQEREVKKAQLSLLIRVKNLLSDAQQAKLNELRHRQ